MERASSNGKTGPDRRTILECLAVQGVDLGLAVGLHPLVETLAALLAQPSAKQQFIHHGRGAEALAPGVVCANS